MRTLSAEDNTKDTDSLIQKEKLEVETAENASKALPKSKEEEWWWTVLDFSFCFICLQVSYLTWGLMQELIMNSQYEPSEMNPSGRFPSATFCVFSNRFVAIIVSAIVVRWRYGTLVTAAPLIAYAPCAFSNTTSSWAQYQALSYVTFSLQTIFKSTKVIPVMLMGTLLKGTKYSWTECLEALLITIGVTTFSLSKSSVSDETIGLQQEIIGFCLLCVYVLSDSFTSQWQSKLYKDYGKIESFQMMFGVNVSSIIFTILAMIISGEIPLVIDFLKHNPTALYYNIITSITSTTGQMAIYYTIKKFGPIVFTVIMTTRQMLSIIISNYYFSHPMTAQSYVGCLIVFGAIAYSIYNKKQAAAAKHAAQKAAAATEEGDPSSKNPV